MMLTDADLAALEARYSPVVVPSRMCAMCGGTGMLLRAAPETACPSCRSGRVNDSTPGDPAVVALVAEVRAHRAKATEKPLRHATPPHDVAAILDLVTPEDVAALRVWQTSPYPPSLRLRRTCLIRRNDSAETWTTSPDGLRVLEWLNDVD